MGGRRTPLQKKNKFLAPPLTSAGRYAKLYFVVGLTAQLTNSRTGLGEATRTGIQRKKNDAPTKRVEPQVGLPRALHGPPILSGSRFQANLKFQPDIDL